jgi:hypothetical protein
MTSRCSDELPRDNIHAGDTVPFARLGEGENDLANAAAVVVKEVVEDAEMRFSRAAALGRAKCLASVKRSMISSAVRI